MMSFGLIGSVSAAVWFFLFVVVHVLGWRSGRSNVSWLIRSYVITLFAALLAAVVLTSGSASVRSGILTLSIVLLTSGCLFILYVPAVYVMLTSLTVQTLVLLRENSGELPVRILYDRFAGCPIVADRLATLTANHYLREQAGVFRLTQRGRHVARFFRLIKGAWKLAPGG